MTEKPLPTAEIIHAEAKAAVATTYAVGSTLVMGHREKYWNEAAIKAIKKYASLHTEQALREFADGMIAFADNVQDRQAVISAAESLRDSLLTEIRK